MSQIKTKKTSKSVQAFIGRLENEQKRRDSLALLDLFQKTTRQKPALWGGSIIGFGQFHYKSDRSAQEGDWPLTGFSPRKQNISIYIMPGFDKLGPWLKKLGKHKTSVSCLYINKLDDVDLDILKTIISQGYTAMKKRYAVE